jgi:hypothetical protein
MAQAALALALSWIQDSYQLDCRARLPGRFRCNYKAFAVIHNRTGTSRGPGIP